MWFHDPEVTTGFAEMRDRIRAMNQETSQMASAGARPIQISCARCPHLALRTGQRSGGARGPVGTPASLELPPNDPLPRARAARRPAAAGVRRPLPAGARAHQLRQALQ